MSILLVDDEEIIHDSLGSYLGKMGMQVAHARSGAEARGLLDETNFGLVLLDVLLPEQSGLELLASLTADFPGLTVVIMTGHGTMDMAVQALRKGAADFLAKPINLRELDAILEKAGRLRRLEEDARRLKQTIGFIQKSDYAERSRWALVGESAASQVVREQIQMAVSGQFDTVLITGETGTGKEVVARELHKKLGSTTPFIAVSCPAIPETLLESELFGHARGAFTGARDNYLGSFEMAHGGILFLDEISELSATAQAKLLRVLETRSIKRVGSTRERTVNTVVVAATNISLESLVQEQRFRADLLYRLNVFTIALKPLRERVMDIGPIAQHFLDVFSQSRGLAVQQITPEAMTKLESHQYPGNARELRNIIERAAVIQREGSIAPDSLQFYAPAVAASPVPSSMPLPSVDASMSSPLVDLSQSAPSSMPSPASLHSQSMAMPMAAEMGRIAGRNAAGNEERTKIVSALESHKWNRREAALAIGMPYSTFRYKLKRYGIS